MKFACLSDIHGDIRPLTHLEKVKDTFDAVLFAGDLVQLGSQYELEEMFHHLDKIGKPVILVPGNHDVALEKLYVRKELKEKYPNVTIVIGRGVCFEGVVILGLPYVKECPRWGFNLDEDMLISEHLPKWEGVDIILSHTPPSDKRLSSFWDDIGFGDKMLIDLGFRTLAKYLYYSNDNIQYCISGHVHERGGGSTIIGKTRCINVSDKIHYIDVEVKK